MSALPPVERRSPLAGASRPGRRGHAEGPAGLRMRERAPVSIVQIATLDHDPALAVDLAARCGIEGDPTSGRMLGSAAWSLRPAGPRTWRLVADAVVANPPDLAGAFAGRAIVTDLSSGRTVLDVSGPRVRDVLAQGISLDLDPRAFAPQASVQTRCGHVGVMLTRLPGEDAFDLIVYRGFALTLWEWLLAAGASVGIDVAG